MDTNIVYRLVVLGLGLVVIGIGAVMTYLGSYLAAPEQKKQSRGRNMLLYGIILVILGFAYLLYCQLVLRG
ncbi:MAG: hypothetical protein NTY79_07615 [Chloroflexi bacterium]|nr:hypothetical protein [Chloroflexota bacterium]